MATAKKTASAPAPVQTDATKATKIKLPKTLAECADLLYTTRAARYGIQKQVDALKAQESALMEELIQKLPKSKASGIAGRVARVKVESKTVPVAKDWDKVNAYILKNAKKNPGVFALYQRRLSDSTIKEMWEAGQDVPGVEPMDIPTVSCTKL